MAETCPTRDLNAGGNCKKWEDQCAAAPAGPDYAATFFSSDCSTVDRGIVGLVREDLLDLLKYIEHSLVVLKSWCQDLAL